MECTLHEQHPDHHTCICETFQFLREWASCMGLNCADLLEVGVPTLEHNQIVRYTCCLEYPLDYLDEHAAVSLGELPGGRYAVTHLEKAPDSVGGDIRLLLDAYLEEQNLQRDPGRPIYEIYNQHSAEYCVPLLD
jgi:DNA gyrase inhibitor GyrI